MELKRGMRDKLDKYVNVGAPIEVEMSISGSSEYDFCCFGVDANDKLNDDRYMIFYNQTTSPNGEISYRAAQNGAVFGVDLTKVPSGVQKLVFTVSIDGAGTMGNISSHVLKVKQNGAEALTLSLSGSDFKQETAIITAEIYMKDVWRINAVARGFNGGLADLLTNFGGEAEYDEPQTAAPAPAPTPAPQSAPAPQAAVQPKPAPQPTAQNVNKQPIEAMVQQQAPDLLPAAQALKSAMAKTDSANASAKTVIVLDMAKNMMWDYDDGSIAKLVRKFAVAAAQLDPEGKADLWVYGDNVQELSRIDIASSKTAIPANWMQLMQQLGGGNDEIKAINTVAQKYSSLRTPVYVIFLTVGNVSDSAKLGAVIRDVSNKPIFWQFIGLNGMRYGAIEYAGNIKGQQTANGSFFEIFDADDRGTEEMYCKMLEKLPNWLNEIRQKGMI